MTRINDDQLRQMEERLAELEQAITANDAHLQNVEAENERLRAVVENFANLNHWHLEVGKAQWMGKRNPIEYARAALGGRNE